MNPNVKFWLIILAIVAGGFIAGWFGRVITLSSDPCKWDPAIHVMHVNMDGKWVCISPEEAG